MSFSRTIYPAVLISLGVGLALLLGQVPKLWQGEAQAQDPKPSVITFELFGTEPHDETDLFMRVENEAGAHFIRVQSISGFSWYPREELLRNAIYVGAAKIETTATEAELRQAIKDSKELFNKVK